MSRSNFLVVAFVIGLFVGIAVCNIVSLQVPWLRADQNVGDAVGGDSGGIIAVTGLCSNNYSGLWVLDARDTKTSPSLCLYIPEGTGRDGFTLTGARRIKYDLKLMSYQGRTKDPSLNPARMQETIEELNKKEEEKAANKKKK